MPTRTLKYVYPHGENKFQTFARVSGRRVSLGLFDDPEVAAGVHDSIAWHALGERRASKLSLVWSADDPPPELHAELERFRASLAPDEGLEELTLLRAALRASEEQTARLRRLIALAETAKREPSTEHREPPAPDDDSDTYGAVRISGDTAE